MLVTRGLCSSSTVFGQRPTLRCRDSDSTHSKVDSCLLLGGGEPGWVAAPCSELGGAARAQPEAALATRSCTEILRPRTSMLFICATAAAIATLSAAWPLTSTRHCQPPARLEPERASQVKSVGAIKGEERVEGSARRKEWRDQGVGCEGRARADLRQPQGCRSRRARGLCCAPAGPASRAST
eukprot:2507722-Rhodomonas_salina.2